jgi:DNA-directed RNA polymerase specialized sigma24 family protein
VLRLYYRQRLELSVIAQICGITVQEVRALLKQGRIELRKLGTETEVVRGRPRHELEPLQQKYLEYLEHMHLSAIYVEVLHLYYREQKRMEDIAVKLDLSVGTVKSRLARGRAAFHEHALAYERWEACGGSLCQEVQMT